MANISSGFQDNYLYGLIWPKPVTEALITFLLTQKATGDWVWNSNNGHSIMAAREYLNSTFRTDYSTAEVIGRVKKLRSQFHLFDHMIAISGVEWDQEMNYLFASQHQWRLWRELYPMSHAYLTAGDPLYYQLKELFTPDNDKGDDDIIIVIDSDDDNNPLIDDLVVHALPAVAYYPLAADIIVISLDDDEEFIDDLFDSDVDLGFSLEEENVPAVVVDDAVSGLSNIDPTHLNPAPIEEEIMSPVTVIQSYPHPKSLFRNHFAQFLVSFFGMNQAAHMKRINFRKISIWLNIMSTV